MKKQFYKNTIDIKKILFIILFIILFLIVFVILYFKKEKFDNNINNDTEYILPKKVWIFWDNEDIPKDISLIINNNINKLSSINFDVKLLNNNTLINYLDINTFPKNYDNLAVQHKSDFLRLKLLQTYGGMWMDASIIINSIDEFENIFTKSLEFKSELTAFTFHDQNLSYKYHQYIENWFLIAPKNSFIINLWLEEFENAINIGFDEYNKYIIDILNVKICEDIQKFGSYLTMHKALQVVLQYKLNNNYIPKLLLFKAEDSMFKLMLDCNYDNNCIENKFYNNSKDIKNIPYIKLIGANKINIDLNSYFT